MKKALSVLLISMLIMSISAQDSKVKTGWNFGALPTITFDSDLGFQYGALVELYQYGTGDLFPNYYHKLYFEVSRFTKGSGIYRFSYDSEHLIPGIRFSTDLAYLPDEAYDFYGFNGYDAVYRKSFIDEELDGGADYKTRMFYKHKRSLFRFKNDFSGKLAGDNLLWVAGFTIQSIKTDSVNVAKFNKGKDAEEQLPFVRNEPGLYDLYQEWGILNAEEADGGVVNTVKLGLSYDSRDNRPNPMKGIWTEAGVETSQTFLGSEATFGKLYFTHRQYFTLIPEDLGFAYRLGYQQTIFGTVPFYYQSQVIVSQMRGATSEGLGGSKTLRGILRNRIIGDGFFYGNAEIRWKALYFNFINQNWYLGVNGFTDFGFVTDKIDFTEPDLSDSGYDITDFFKADEEKLHISAGAGLRVVMNQNFIIAIDLGKAFNEQDGGMGFYMGLNYLF